MLGSRSRGGGGDFDLVVIGGGTGGLVSALVGAGAGARVALVERERLGGDCLWTGCVPSKSLLAAADLAHRIRHADRVGLPAAEPDVDFAAVMGHVRRAQKRIEPHDSAQRLTREGVTVVAGEAAFVRSGVIAVGERRLRYRKAIIATGSAPLLPAIPGLAAANPLTSDTVWELDRRPDSLIVLGGGPIGCELAQGFARLGATVTLIEAGPRLLAREEPAAGELIDARLRAEGVDVRLNTHVREIDRGVLRLGPGTAVGFDRLLVAAGRIPVTAGLGLERAGVLTRADGAIEVDGRMQTTARHIYAAGDVTGGPAFTHVAALHARVATVNALFGARRQLAGIPIPRVTFTDPEVASVGLTGDEARVRWPGAVTTSFDYAELDRAITDGRAEGFVTLIGDPKGRLVGATIAAPGAGESIAELTAWLSLGAKIDRVSQTVHAYPTWSEGPSRAADAHVRARFAAPGTRRALRAALWLLRRVDRPR